MIGRPAKHAIHRVICIIPVFYISILSFAMAEPLQKVDQKEILVFGNGNIIDGNVAAARKKAISEALVRGVEEYLARRLGSQGMINNFHRLINDIIPGAKEEIENFHILAEEQKDRQYRILVRLKVNEKVMEEKLREMGLILMEGPPIKILFLVSEIRPQEDRIYFWWDDPESDTTLTATELALLRVFQERGFNPINRLMSIPDESYSPEMKGLNLSDEDAIRWGRLYSAEVVIYGRSKVIEGEIISVVLKALHVENERVIYEDTQTEGMDIYLEGTDQVMTSIERTINHIAQRLGPEIIKAMKAPVHVITKLEIELRGLKSFEQFRRFRDFLKKEIEGVKSVIQTKISGSSISILVEYSGNRDGFMDLVLGHGSFPFLTDVRKTETGWIMSIK